MRGLAREHDADPELVERVYRTMTDCIIERELRRCEAAERSEKPAVRPGSGT